MSWLILLLTIALVCGSAPVFADDDERYLNCMKSFDCGNIKGVGYPFSGSDRPDYCGYPGFELGCSNQDPEITIMQLSYKLLGINSQSRTLNVSRTDYTKNLCPTLLSNTSLNPNLLSSTSDHAEVTLYYGCPSPSPPALSSQFTCNINDTVMVGNFITVNYSVLSITDPSLISYLTTCNNSVKFPAHQSAIVPILVSSNVSQFLEAINQGFELEWSANDSLCDTCESSGGQCGYNKTTTAFTCYCADQPQDFECSSSPQAPSQSTKSSWSRGQLHIAVGISAAVAAIITFSIITICLTRRKGSFSAVIAKIFRPKNSQHADSVETFMMDYHSLTPKRYSYSDIKKMTSSFVNILGQGGFGYVYRGKLLDDGRLVAVKVLKESKGDGEEFMNEVASISRTSHVNVVTLLGFCYERNKRALIYEFMPNGSLDSFISDKGTPLTNCRLEWKKLYEIAVGIARGLEYLHRGCNTRIVHFDIKPHNILLDDEFCPKISDFGLAKLCQSKVSKISMIGARGTVGYIAPEVFCRSFGGVTYKSDVYSYGMMVLEMVGQRKDFDIGSLETNEMYFPNWFYMYLEPGKISTLHGGTTEEEEEIVEKMILVGLWCIQTIPSHRPSMTKVVEMFEGSLQSLQIPPRPSFSSPRRSAQEHSSIVSSLPCVSSQGDEVNKLPVDESDL
ncbi:LEAF RUST 10 DISEASE-RESISTANCE LOCUS RECEPTOR-LIKE PROTEIN KINASE-like 2.1 isoform X1 [Populus nigra]|uniref:LEAF RUST 10 DISEASE-RESISTANCE LOCUS RECEPTOR-LIKE PROTEIN KINASE-like 2.1 isoform X1 n=1 Tax=Populus nigra TaxID=3691 RepID=UPI002B26CE22|nr:LEAF RUST 10 DISEASE-RESISTANCE LOCUS RECEPTOR-LIKE PROTEIN KINASE-like 2.1 isoform X1 [Populus nigra]